MNERDMDSTSRNDFTSASAKDGMEMPEEQLEGVLIEATETLNKLLADVIELQVECVQREIELSRLYNPGVLAEARGVLDSDDAFDGLDEMWNTNSTTAP